MKKILFFSACLAFISFAMTPVPHSAHVETFDGPHVSYGNGQIYFRSIMNDHGKYSVRTDSVAETNRASVVLTVATDVAGETFSFPLKKKIEEEKSEYRKVSKQLVISDIEANFGALRKLLVAGGVIDQQFNWTFGEGHLVLTGDFLDRGDRQTEVLWLIYALEEKAEAAGGHVHYVLGNHEIMNLSGDLRYLNAKYNEVAALLGESYMSLLGEQTELGRWLRSKNIVQRVGENLYVHGGISADVNLLDLSAKQINELSRPWYADTSYAYPDPRIGILYYENGPFWYRGYYAGNTRASGAQVDSTLQRHRVNHIVTGHTIIAPQITAVYEGKVINTDVSHASGKSEALLIDGKQHYRVLPTGEKIPLKLK